MIYTHTFEGLKSVSHSNSYVFMDIHWDFIELMNMICHHVIYLFILWYSAPPPPLQAATFSRGVVTMRCDISTCSSAHISLLVSGSAQTCFNDQVPSNFLWYYCLSIIDVAKNKHYLLWWYIIICSANPTFLSWTFYRHGYIYKDVF